MKLLFAIAVFSFYTQQESTLEIDKIHLVGFVTKQQDMQHRKTIVIAAKQVLIFKTAGFCCDGQVSCLTVRRQGLQKV